MVQGIQSREKRYVKVVSVTDEDGRITPVSVEWEDGHVYGIDRVLDVRHAASLKVGGTGIRYLVRIGHTSTYLFHEDPRWYVEAKVLGV
jgi:hypothetical protein